jgi:hypothetical protein
MFCEEKWNNRYIRINLSKYCKKATKCTNYCIIMYQVIGDQQSLTAKRMLESLAGGGD